MTKQIVSKNTENSNELYTVLPTNKKGVADVGSKICTKCNTDKNINQFSFVYGRKRKDGTRKGRYHSQCKECRKNVLKNWRDKNPEKAKESRKNWLANNLEKNKKTKKEYKKKNANKVKKWKRDWTMRLEDSYVIGILCAENNLKESDIRKYPELIKTKRLIIKTSRLCRTSQN